MLPNLSGWLTVYHITFKAQVVLPPQGNGLPQPFESLGCVHSQKKNNIWKMWTLTCQVFWSMFVNILKVILVESLRILRCCFPSVNYLFQESWSLLVASVKADEIIKNSSGDAKIKLTNSLSLIPHQAKLPAPTQLYLKLYSAFNLTFLGDIIVCVNNHINFAVCQKFGQFPEKEQIKHTKLFHVLPFFVLNFVLK